MTAYLTDPVFRAYPSRAAALAAYPEGAIVESESDIMLSGKKLTEAYNALTGNTVKRFGNHRMGLRRFWKALTQLKEEEVKVEEAYEEQAEEQAARNGRSKYADNQVIVFNKSPVEQCKPGKKNHERFQHLQDGMTVKQALIAGLTRADINEAAKRAWISFA